MKKFLLVFSILFALALPTAAGDANGNIRQIISCSDSWFEIEIVGKTMLYGGSQKLIRFMVRTSAIGPEKYKQMYAMSLTAFAVQSSVWLGTGQATGVSISGGNCNTNNTPAQEVLGMSTYR
jgi:hypothetical protein